MVDRQFADASLAALYDVLHPWQGRADLQFYLPRLMAARSVLDVGCGTGMLLHAARASGHTGRLVGLDPSAGMLARARTRDDVGWVLGDLGTVRWDREFDLVVMTGHAFQVFIDDDEIRAALATIRSALTDDGRFLFETRNPAVRTWETWVPENGVEMVTAEGTVLRMEHRIDTPVEGDLVSFTTTYAVSGWERAEQSRSILRFLGPEALSAFLARGRARRRGVPGGLGREPVHPGRPGDHRLGPTTTTTVTGVMAVR